MTRTAINSKAAPAAIGAYSQAMRAGDTLFISGQIPLDPISGDLVSDPAAAIERVLDNLEAIAREAGASLADNAVKVGVFLTDMGHFPLLNAAMEARFNQPYPARAAIEVKGLPKGAVVEMDAILWLG